jgi:hypothetical protein
MKTKTGKHKNAGKTNLNHGVRRECPMHDITDDNLNILLHKAIHFHVKE